MADFPSNTIRACITLDVPERGNPVDAITAWLRDAVAVPDVRLGRKGGICPFVPAALRASLVEIVLEPTGRHPSQNLLRNIVRNTVLGFDRRSVQTAGNRLQSLIIAFPELADTAVSALDAVHRDMKAFVVDAGLMFAQFHPRCDERSVRNRDVVVGRSPVPLLAFRRMAEHDILFLGEQRTWFDAFASSFGHLFTASQELDPFVLDAFQSAQRAHARSAQDRGR